MAANISPDSCPASAVTEAEPTAFSTLRLLAAIDNLLDNLCLIVDNNNLQIDGAVSDVMNIYPIDEKFKSFGFEVINVDGHNIPELISAFEQAKKVKGKPTVIIANTIKGKGVSFMENEVGWHGKAPNEEEYKQAMKELGGAV